MLHLTLRREGERFGFQLIGLFAMLLIGCAWFGPGLKAQTFSSGSTGVDGALNYPTPGTPLKKDGMVDLTAKAPRAFNRKPDLSGVWRIEPPKPGEIERLYHPSEVNAVAGDDWRDFDRHFFNLFIDFKEGESPLRPEAIAQTERIRQDPLALPSARCLPLGFLTRYFHFRPFKIFQAQQEIVMYFEVDGVFRQIHTDGRKLPESPFPSWMGFLDRQVGRRFAGGRYRRVQRPVPARCERSS